MSDIHIISIISIVFGALIVLHILCRKQPYTTEQWNRILEDDFKKYGAVPENEE